MPKKKKPRLARLIIKGYVVDLNNKDMVESAIEAFYEDLTQWIKYNTLSDAIIIEETAPKLKKSDIPEFLLEEQE